MALWIVTNDWHGYGREGVIVEAADADEATAQARLALTADWSDEFDRWQDAPGGEHRAEHAAKHLESYQPGSSLGWDVEEITLPHIGEF